MMLQPLAIEHEPLNVCFIDPHRAEIRSGQKARLLLSASHIARALLADDVYSPGYPIQ
jgi:hypothetical protein